MNSEPQTLLAEANAILAVARSLNETGQHGAAMKQAYHASEYVAASYLLAVTGQHLPPSDAAYDLFANTIRDPSRNPDVRQKFKETTGKVGALREAYEPALLNETTLKDAQQMIDCVAALVELIGELSPSNAVI